MPAVEGGDVHGGPAVDADVDVKDGQFVLPVVVSVVEFGPHEVLAARRDGPERVAAPRAVGEVPEGSVQVGPVRVVVRRPDAGVVPCVDVIGVGD